MMTIMYTLELVWMLLIIAHVVMDVEAKMAPHIWCGACVAMVEDMKIQIASADKTKKIQIGSYRLKADGSQDRREVPYATTDLFLIEQLEGICNAMHHYAETIDGKGNKVIIRKSSYDGTSVSMKNITTSDTLTRSLVFACETIIEDHEEELIKSLKGLNRKTQEDEIEMHLCVNVARLCTYAGIRARMWAMAGAVMAGIQEKADEKLEQIKGQDELDAKLAAGELDGGDDTSSDEQDKDEDLSETPKDDTNIEVVAENDEL